MPSNIPDIATLLEAARFAADKHVGQRRKGASHRPYINHPIEVAETVARVGGITDTAVLCAALLHDTVEDTDTTPEEIESRFGRDVAALVAEMTDEKGLRSDVRKRLQVENAPHKSPGARAIKLADKISNVREIGVDPPADWSEDRRRDYFTWAAEVIDALRGQHPSLETLFDETVAKSRRILDGRE